jgi:hypothetical protein
MLMLLDILENNKYISAIEAAGWTGYATDYIGQLCRLGKIPGELRGRNWYVDLDALISHRQERQLGRRRKQVSADKYSAPGEPMVKAFRLKTQAHFSYKPDDQPLFPQLNKNNSAEPLRKEMKPSLRVLVMVFSLVLVWGMGGLFNASSSSTRYLDLTYLPAKAFSLYVDPLFVDQTGISASTYLGLVVEAVQEFLGT